MSPMNRVCGFIDSGMTEGARAVVGGKRVGDAGYFVEPTVLEGVTAAMACRDEETFGPVVSLYRVRSDDEAVRKLVPLITSRRHEMEEVDKALKEFAEKTPATERDRKLTALFSASLAEINAQRASIINGIERFQRRQVARAKKLEDEGIALAALQSKAVTGDSAATPERVTDAQQRYDWDARVFQERQQNIPIACEIPVLVEQRIFALAQSIRALMSN